MPMSASATSRLADRGSPGRSLCKRGANTFTIDPYATNEAIMNAAGT